jgi:hypothetical protein
MDAHLSYPEKIAARFAAIHEAVRQQVEADKDEMGEYINVPIVPLATELGCRSAIEVLSAEIGRPVRIHNPTQPDPVYEDLVSRALLEVLRISYTAHADHEARDSVLDGMLLKNRWRLCLETQDDAYRFAETLVTFHYNLQEDSGYRTFRTTIAPDVRNAVVQWVSPRFVPEQLTVLEIARLMLGSAWCDLRLDNEPTRWAVNKLIWAERPPFMPGLLPAHLEADGVLLTGMAF